MGLFVGLDGGCDVRGVFMDMGKECRGLDMIGVGVGLAIRILLSEFIVIFIFIFYKYNNL